MNPTFKQVTKTRYVQQVAEMAHEIFVHHSRLPRRGEGVAHQNFAMLLHSKKVEGPVM